MSHAGRQRIDTLVIGGGQAGLAVGYHLSQRDLPFLIVDANERTGDSWRNRWDSLRLFTPNRFSGLPGKPYPDQSWSFATKDEMADYLEDYARAFELPVRRGVEVERLHRRGERFVATARDMEIEADTVVVAMSSWQVPRIPPFASDLDPRIIQCHVTDYRNPSQLHDGPVLVVGAGNSGAEISKELASNGHEVRLSGPSTGQLPFRPESKVGRIMMPIVGKVFLHRLFATSTPVGRKVRPKFLSKGEPLLRVKARDLAALGVERVGRTIGVADGYPELEDGSVVEVANVVWCTGFEPGFSWIDLPVFDEAGKVIHERGVVGSEPGLFFIGLKLLYAPSSSTLLGIGRDAGYVADRIAERSLVNA